MERVWRRVVGSEEEEEEEGGRGGLQKRQEITGVRGTVHWFIGAIASTMQHNVWVLQYKLF